MSNPDAFKIVSFGTPSAFDPRGSQKSGKSGNSGNSCSTITLPINGNDTPGTLDLSGVCTVVQQPTSESFEINLFTNCVNGQIITFYGFSENGSIFIQLNGTTIKSTILPNSTSIIRVNSNNSPVFGYCLNGVIYLTGQPDQIP